jgi:hypothetical protein
MDKVGTKIIILGAGASIGAKRYPIKNSFSQVANRMPSANNFFYDLNKTNKTDNRPAGSLDFLGLSYEGLYNLIARAWNINVENHDPEDWKGVNIEEVMTFLEVGAKMFHPNSKDQQVFKKAQEYLLDFMYPLIPMRCDEQHCEHLLKVFMRLKKRDSILTYNWDSIADYTLQKIGAEQLKNYAKMLRADKINQEDYFDKGMYLKLHGSFNWMKCENKECLYHKKVRPPFQKGKYQLLSDHKLWTCECGNKHVKPFIVPPVSDKMIHKHSLLKNQWFIARDKLVTASELVFIGYSFPPSDFYSEWLFRELNFLVNNNVKKITIVNPEYRKRNSLVRNRYDAIFKNYEKEIFNTLAEYAKSV